MDLILQNENHVWISFYRMRSWVDLILQNEIHELSRQNDLLQRELKDKEREINKERRDSERVRS